MVGRRRLEVTDSRSGVLINAGVVAVDTPAARRGLTAHPPLVWRKGGEVGYWRSTVSTGSRPGG